MEGSEQRSIQSLDRACRLIGTLQDREAATISELASEIDLSPGSVHTHLATLKQHGLVIQDGNEYRLGPTLIPLGEHVKLQMAVYEGARDELERLSHDIDGVAHLMCENNLRLVSLHVAYGRDAIGKDLHTSRRGEPQDHVHCTAGGKAILAHSSEAKIERVLGAPLPEVTSNTITDRAELENELEEVRDLGYAFNDEERLHGIRGVAAPILYEDRAIGAISISGPAKEWKGEKFRQELPQLVMRATNTVEVKIYSDENLESKLMV